VFTVAFLPDTQILCNQAALAPYFLDQLEWCNSRRVEQKIEMVMSEGDIVNNGGAALEWGRAHAAIALLDVGSTPYLFSSGNHDYEVHGGRVQTPHFDTEFPQSRYTGKAWFTSGGFFDSSALNLYCIRTINGLPVLFMAIEFGPRDSVLAWADGVLKANPTVPAIISVHSMVMANSTQESTVATNNPHTYSPLNADCNSGTEIWTKLIFDNPNVIWVACGHQLGLGSHVDMGYGTAARRTDLNVSGVAVNQVHSNHQEDLYGGRGMIRLVQFDLVTRTAFSQTYSPGFHLLLTDATHEFHVAF
jgi:hypothetical protein